MVEDCQDNFGGGWSVVCTVRLSADLVVMRVWEEDIAFGVWIRCKYQGGEGDMEGERLG